MQMDFKLDGRHDIRGSQPTSMDTAPRPSPLLIALCTTSPEPDHGPLDTLGAN